MPGNFCTGISVRFFLSLLYATHTDFLTDLHRIDCGFCSTEQWRGSYKALVLEHTDLAGPGADPFLRFWSCGWDIVFTPRLVTQVFEKESDGT